MSSPVAQAEAVKERTVEVVAPSNLAGGYEFIVNAGNNVSYKVRVPEGGVTAGQRFQAIIISEGTAGGAHNIPSGRWRDELCDCCTFGCCHPVCCLGFWCHPCALGQVLHRMKLNVCASPSPNGQYPATSAFKILFVLVALVHVVINVVAFATAESTTTTSSATNTSADVSVQAETSTAGYLIQLLYAGLYLFVFLIACQLRGYIRSKYSIQGSCCSDCCCTYWCTCCSICQMSRHTADFNNHRAACCSDNGLGRGVPDVV